MICELAALLASRRSPCWSKREDGWLQSSCWKSSATVSVMFWAAVVKRWSSSWGSICGGSPSTLIDYFCPIVTRWFFFLKVYSWTVFPTMDFSIVSPTSFALSTFTVQSAVTPVEMFRTDRSKSNGFRSCKYPRRVKIYAYILNKSRQPLWIS